MSRLSLINSAVLHHVRNGGNERCVQCSQLEKQALEDAAQAQEELAARVAEARAQALAEAGQQLLTRNQELEQELTEHTAQVWQQLTLEGASLESGSF